MRLHHVRLDKEVRIADALTFMAADRSQAEEAYRRRHHRPAQPRHDQHRRQLQRRREAALHRHPELRAGTVPPRGAQGSAAHEGAAKGLAQLCEEGATQLFKPLRNNDLILGAVGQLQFEVVAFRLQDEYSVQCVFEPINVATARWVSTQDEKRLAEFRVKATTTWRSIMPGSWCTSRPPA